MIIACPACNTRYVVPDEAIGVEGRTVRCAKCKHNWFQDGPELAEREPVAKPAPAPAPPPPPPPPPAPEPAPSAAAEEPATSAEDAPDCSGSPDEASAAGDPATDQAEEAARPSVSHWRTPDRSDTGSGEDEAAEVESAPDAAEQTGAEAGDAGEDEPPEAPPTYEDHAADSVEETAADAGYAGEDDEDFSQFEYEPPFRARRNPLKMWTAAGVVFALLAFGTIIGVSYWGMPDWVPVERPTFAVEEPDLVLDFPAGQQDRRTLPNGTEYFGASGTITNVGRSSADVPSILIILRDERDRIVYNWEVLPPQSELAPGETLTIKEAVTDVPRSAKFAEIGWKPE